MGEGQKLQTSRYQMHKSWDVIYSMVNIVNNVTFVYLNIERVDINNSHPKKERILTICSDDAN